MTVVVLLQKLVSSKLFVIKRRVKVITKSLIFGVLDSIHYHLTSFLVRLIHSLLSLQSPRLEECSCHSQSIYVPISVSRPPTLSLKTPLHQF